YITPFIFFNLLESHIQKVLYRDFVEINNVSICQNGITWVRSFHQNNIFPSAKPITAMAGRLIAASAMPFDTTLREDKPKDNWMHQ
ncbi:TPA: hypothetical protein ACUEMK_004750, partial [Escherichia coli]